MVGNRQMTSRSGRIESACKNFTDFKPTSVPSLVGAKAVIGPSGSHHDTSHGT